MDTVQVLNNSIQSGGMDLIITTATVIIAFAAVFIPLYQIVTTRKHNRLSVKPHIDITISDIPDITVENNGVGPAKIKSFEIYLEGTKIPLSIKSEKLDPIREKLGFSKFPFRHRFFNKGSFMKPGEPIIALADKDPIERDIEVVNKIHSIIQKAKVRVVYESIYGEKFPPAKLN